MKKKPCIILTGPTAVGKTKLSISLAKAIHGEIISADSMQVYRYMNIGSAKISKDEMQGIPHFLIDEISPDEEFNVVKFQSYAKSYMSGIYQRGHIPILVGGTGFYIQSVLYDVDFIDNEENSTIRAQLQQYLEKNGCEALHKRLALADPVSAEAIHPNNSKRIIRALEFYQLTGKKISEHNQEQRKKESPYNFIYFVLNDNRNILYQRIDERVDNMIENGLVEEVQCLKQRGYTRDMVSMQGLGYKEILDYLDGMISMEEAIYRIKRDTRHFAKRQITWFNREEDVCWVNKPDFAYNEIQILQFMMDKINNQGLLQK